MTECCLTWQDKKTYRLMMNNKRLKCMSETRTLSYCQGEGRKIMRITAKGKENLLKKIWTLMRKKDSKQQNKTSTMK